MSTVFISLILTAIIIILIFFFSFTHKQKARKKKEGLLAKFSQLGITQGLSFSSQEVLGDEIIGLDGIHRKFVIVNEVKDTVVLLDEVKNCKVNVRHETYNMGDSKKADLERHLIAIHLIFEFINKREPVSVVFYDNMVHPLAEAFNLEHKAKDWEILLSKMISGAEKARA